MGTETEKNEMDLCGEYLGPGHLGQVLKIKCKTVLIGSKVLLLLHADGTSQILNLTEVELYGVEHSNINNYRCLFYRCIWSMLPDFSGVIYFCNFVCIVWLFVFLLCVSVFHVWF